MQTKLNPYLTFKDTARQAMEFYQSVYQKLSSRGTATRPLEKASWGDSFGMRTDPFGVSWLVNISAR